MKLLLIIAQPLPPQQTGGSQNAALELAARLRDVGDDVTVAGRLHARSLSAAPFITNAIFRGQFYSTGRCQGVSTIRFVRERHSLPRLLNSLRPDVVLLHSMSSMPIARIVSGLGIPLVVFWHDVELHRLHGSPVGLRARYIANSAFTAAFYSRTFGVISDVVHPIFAPIRAPSYVNDGLGSVLFVNPVAEKGLATAIEIAQACPELAFEFLESWTLSAANWRKLRKAVIHATNITLTRRQDDITTVYRRSRLLIVPSIWQEAWGRVVSEAQACGIPVIATDIGGLPESVGTGGILIPLSASPNAWAETIRRVLADPIEYGRLSVAARARASLPDMDPASNAEKVRRVLFGAIRSMGTS